MRKRLKLVETHFHERKDENRNVGLGPEHDWSSHAADAFGYMAISYEEPPVKSTASFKNGILSVTLPKSASTEAGEEDRSVERLRRRPRWPCCS
jgi:hypothetical protein